MQMSLRFLDSCTAADGAGIYVNGKVNVSAHIVFSNCTAVKSGGAVSATGPVDVQSAVIQAEGSEDADTFSTGNHSIHIGRLDCFKSAGCRLRGRSPTVDHLQCPPGEGFDRTSKTAGCARCPVKHTRLAPAASACTPCPNMTSLGCEHAPHVRA